MEPNACPARQSPALNARLRLFAKIFLLVAIFVVLAGARVPAQAQVIHTIAGGFNPSHSPLANACAPLLSAQFF